MKRLLYLFCRNILRALGPFSLVFSTLKSCSFSDISLTSAAPAYFSSRGFFPLVCVFLGVLGNGHNPQSPQNHRQSQNYFMCLAYGTGISCISVGQMNLCMSLFFPAICVDLCLAQTPDSLAPHHTASLCAELCLTLLSKLLSG